MANLREGMSDLWYSTKRLVMDYVYLTEHYIHLKETVVEMQKRISMLEGIDSPPQRTCTHM